MEVPKYLDSALLKTVVQKGYNLDEVEIISTNIEIATSPGDNFISIIYRVFMTLADSKKDLKKIQFILKDLTNMEQGGLSIDYRAIYDKEIDMLRNILPKFTKITQGVQFSPRFYYAIPESHMMIIAMEDLKEFNYRMVKRGEGLDYEHCRLSLIKLGQLHAASMLASIDADDPSSMKKYEFGVLYDTEEKAGMLRQFFPLHFTKLCEVVKNWEGFEAISKKLERMKDKFWSIAGDSIAKKYDGYRVLNHSDFSMNNILFKYNESTGKPIDVKIVDFQNCFYTTPANDLQFFFNSSLQYDVRENHRDDLLRIYYDAFASSLNNLQQELIPSFRDLEEEMRKKEMFGFLAAVFVLPVVLMEKPFSQKSGFDDLLDENARKDLTMFMFSGQKYGKAMKAILKRCDDLKVFDINY